LKTDGGRLVNEQECRVLRVTMLSVAIATRSLGHEVKMRPHRDQAAGATIICDPTQTALSAAVVVAWRLFVKILSVEHDVYLQVSFSLAPPDGGCTRRVYMYIYVVIESIH